MRDGIGPNETEADFQDRVKDDELVWFGRQPIISKETWQHLGEWLEGRPGHRAYTFPLGLGQCKSSNSRIRVERGRAGVIFYSPGWGWRLHTHWRESLEEAFEPLTNPPTLTGGSGSENAS